MYFTDISRTNLKKTITDSETRKKMVVKKYHDLWVWSRFQQLTKVKKKSCANRRESPIFYMLFWE